jgi:hypothetical protein
VSKAENWVQMEKVRFLVLKRTYTISSYTYLYNSQVPN